MRPGRFHRGSNAHYSRGGSPCLGPGTLHGGRLRTLATDQVDSNPRRRSTRAGSKRSTVLSLGSRRLWAHFLARSRFPVLGCRAGPRRSTCVWKYKAKGTHSSMAEVSHALCFRTRRTLVVHALDVRRTNLLTERSNFLQDKRLLSFASRKDQRLPRWVDRSYRRAIHRGDLITTFALK